MSGPPFSPRVVQAALGFTASQYRGMRERAVLQLVALGLEHDAAYYLIAELAGTDLATLERRAMLATAICPHPLLSFATEEISQ